MADEAPATCRALHVGNDLVDVTPLLEFPQTEAARLLGYAASTLSKRWTEVQTDTTRRPNDASSWPFRRIKHMDQLYAAIVSTLDPYDGVGSIDGEVQLRLLSLMDTRQELVPLTFIRKKQIR